MTEAELVQIEQDYSARPCPDCGAHLTSTQEAALMAEVRRLQRQLARARRRIEWLEFSDELTDRMLQHALDRDCGRDFCVECRPGRVPGAANVGPC